MIFRLAKFPIALGLLLIFTAMVGNVSAESDQELRDRATWQAADPIKVKESVDGYLGSLDLDEATRTQVDQLWASPADDGPALLNQVVETFALVDPQVAELVRFCQAPDLARRMPDLTWLTSDSLPALVRDNCRLYAGKWFGLNQMYNESLGILDALTVDQVVDPASLLFYRSAACYRLRMKAEGLESLRQLLAAGDQLPVRFLTVAELMQADLQALQVDSLDEIARIMDSVRVRLALGRAGKRVRSEEDEVIEKLEKLIKKKEEQQQQQQQQMAQNGGSQSNPSAQPMPDSMLPGGRSSAEVDPKKLGKNSEWGDLPPKKREEALQSLGKDFPSHYRDVIEEYFRRLAREDIHSE